MSFARTAGMGGWSPVPRVNLLPAAEIERRDRTTLARRWFGGVVIALVVIAAVSAGTYALSMIADQRLASENARTTDLLGQLSTLSDVSKIRAVQKDLEAYRTEAMGTDVAWGPVLDTFQKLVPKNAEITGWDLTTGALPGDAAATETPGVTATLTLASSTPVDLVATVRGIRTAPGVLDADAVELTSASSEGSASTYTYRLTTTLDQSVYTGLYATKDK
ncbi:PilN domain-containing protein [Microbacterium sp.]|uniref:PilN domain-containing protein n=1 Tax=Microbacterium sp. TaxID=51671 RepID=UPI003A905F07